MVSRLCYVALSRILVSLVWSLADNSTGVLPNACHILSATLKNRLSIYATIKYRGCVDLCKN